MSTAEGDNEKRELLQNAGGEFDLDEALRSDGGEGGI